MSSDLFENVFQYMRKAHDPFKNIATCNIGINASTFLYLGIQTFVVKRAREGPKQCLELWSPSGTRRLSIHLSNAKTSSIRHSRSLSMTTTASEVANMLERWVVEVVLDVWLEFCTKWGFIVIATCMSCSSNASMRLFGFGLLLVSFHILSYVAMLFAMLKENFTQTSISWCNGNVPHGDSSWILSCLLSSIICQH